MATGGSFSGHLLTSYSAAQSLRPPFGQPAHDIAIHGPMSFSPHMHGTFGMQSSFLQDNSFSEMSEDSARKIASMQAKLNKKLGPEYISQRPGPGGGPKLTYAEGAPSTCLNLTVTKLRAGQAGRSSTLRTKCEHLFVQVSLVSLTTDWRCVGLGSTDGARQ